MADDKLLPGCPDVKVKLLSEEVSVGDTLRRLKNEQSFLGKKAYDQLASMLVSIPCEGSKQSPEQKTTLNRIATFTSAAEDFKKILNENRLGVKEIILDVERKFAETLLQTEISQSTSKIKDLNYTYEAASKLASTLTQAYLKQAGKYLAAVSAKQDLPRLPN